MPDLREVFEMVKQQTEPDQDSWTEQERRIRQSQRRRKYGAIALVAALVVVIAVVVASNLDADDQGVAPASVGPSSVPAGPAGSELAFVDLATGATTGTGIVPGGSEVDVSPDGTKMTFVDQSGAVAVANADGSNVQPFGNTISAEDASAPRWSPDGTQIVYQLEGGQNIGNLFVLDVTSGQVTQITHLPSRSASLSYMAPTFSADGSSVLFTMPHVVLYPGITGRQVEWGLFTVPASGGKPTLVHENAGAVDVEPGGDSITFVGIRAVDGQPRFGALYVARSDGSEVHKLVDGALLLPRWSPDGSEIAYTDLGHHRTDVVDVATGDSRKILDRGEWPEWVNQQTLIVDLSD